MNEPWMNHVEDSPLFTLLFTNDFHNHLNSAQAVCLHRLRRALGNRGLMLDAGDAVQSGNITFRLGGEPILTTMSEIGYDAMTVGNREFHVSRVGFHSKVGLARFPVLCANIKLQTAPHSPSDADIPADTLVDASSNAPKIASKQYQLPTQPFLVHDFCTPTQARMRVVLFGLTVPMVTTRMMARKVSAYVFDDPLTTAADLVPRLRAEYKPDLIVALTHIGIGQDRRLAQAVPNIDLIIGGHTHAVLEHGEWVGDTLLAQAGSHGKFFGRVDWEPAADVSRRHCLIASLTPLPAEPSEAMIQAQERLLLDGASTGLLCDSPAMRTENLSST